MTAWKLLPSEFAQFHQFLEDSLIDCSTLVIKSLVNGLHGIIQDSYRFKPLSWNEVNDPGDDSSRNGLDLLTNQRSWAFSCFKMQHVCASLAEQVQIYIHSLGIEYQKAKGKVF